MVAVVQIERWKEKNLWEKIRLQIKRYAAAQTDAESPWGEYRVFHVCDRKIRWEQLEKAAGRENMQVLLPDGLAPPAGFPIFSAESFRENLFDTAAKRLLSQLRCPMKDRQIFLADQKGERLEWLEHWIPYSSVFRVVCENQECCREMAQSLLDEYGAVLQYDEALPVRAGGILMDPSGWLCPWKGFRGLILTAARQPGKGICIEPSGEAAKGVILPKGILLVDFLAAILQESTLPPVEIACQGWKNGRTIPWDELLRLASESCLER